MDGSLPAADSRPGRRPSRRAAVRDSVGRLVVAVREGDEQQVERAVVALSERRRLLAPLALVAGAFVMLFDALRILVTNWRLTLVQIVPAMLIWLAMFDLKIHALHGRSFHVVRGATLLAAALAVVAITAAAYFLNATFAFAISEPGSPDIKAGFRNARAHLHTILGWGAGIGVALALAALVAPRSAERWFILSMSVVIGLMMFTYVAVPSRLLGLTKGGTAYSRRDMLAATTVGGAVGAVVCTPPYLMERIGILMLGSKVLLVPAIVLIAIGVVLQAGATGSVHAIKLSAKLVAARAPGPQPAE
ncbi:MAG TPA: hypothetical protein VIB48_19525 [Acidimicrobiia bacterium]